jgi:lysophospholipase L1-like esterase
VVPPGSPVGYITDLTGNGLAWKQGAWTGGSDAARAEALVGGGIGFAGTQWMLDDLSLAGACTVALVFESSTFANLQNLGSWKDGSGNWFEICLRDQVETGSMQVTFIGGIPGGTTLTAFGPECAPGVVRHVVFVTWDGASAYTFHADGVPMVVSASGAFLRSASDTSSVGANSNGAVPLTGALYERLVWDTVLSPSDIAAASAQLMTEWAVAPYYQLISYGDSLTYGAGVTSEIDTYEEQAALLYAHPSTRMTWGMSGRTAQNMALDIGVEIIPSLGQYPRAAVLLWAGTNDIALAGQTPAQTWASIQSLCASIKAAGAKAIVGTVLPRGPAGISPTFENDRQVLNALIRGGLGAVYDALFDVGANANIGQAGDYANPTYYAVDETHLTTAGYAIVASLVVPAVDSIWP